MRAIVQRCHSAFPGGQPHFFVSSLLSQGLKGSASLTSPQIAPAPWPSQRLFHHNHIRPGSAARFEQPRHASFGWGILGIVCVIGGVATAQLLFSTAPEKETSPPDSFHHQQQNHYDFTGIIDTLKMNSTDIPEGHLGNLTKEQEVKLREMWAVLFKLFGIKFEGEQLEKQPTNQENSDSKKKSRRSFFGFGGAKKEESAAPDVGGLTLSDQDDKYGLNEDFKQAVAKLTPEQLRESLWSMLKADHPDALLLRFLRARKWDVNKAVVMLVSTMRWRLVEMHVDDDVMEGGEAKAIEQSESSDPEIKRLGADFMDQTRMGKSFITGIDKQGRPICCIRVRMHKIGVHSEKSTERYTVHMIETARLMLPRPIETAVILFDMTGFTLANMVLQTDFFLNEL